MWLVTRHAEAKVHGAKWLGELSTTFVTRHGGVFPSLSHLTAHHQLSTTLNPRTMDQRRPPEYIIEVFADPSSVKDVVRGK